MCIHVFFEKLFCQLEAMGVELELAAVTMKNSEERIKYLEDHLNKSS
jgi:hypothetical protein